MWTYFKTARVHGPFFSLVDLVINVVYVGPLLLFPQLCMCFVLLIPSLLSSRLLGWMDKAQFWEKNRLHLQYATLVSGLFSDSKWPFGFPDLERSFEVIQCCQQVFEAETILRVLLREKSAKICSTFMYIGALRDFWLNIYINISTITSVCPSVHASGTLAFHLVHSSRCLNRPLYAAIISLRSQESLF